MSKAANRKNKNTKLNTEGQEKQEPNIPKPNDSKLSVIKTYDYFLEF